MSTGILYGIGVGPGDPELLTRKAVRLLRSADVIAAPDAGGESGTALSIVREEIEGTPVVLCPSPMTWDRTAMALAWERNADTVCALLEEGKTVAFITLGDPSVYSTYSYLCRRVLKRGYRVETVPGVPSFCAAAARLNRPLCVGQERLLIVPASGEGMEETLSFRANQVWMKAGRRLGALLELLRREGQRFDASVVSNCGLPGEQVYHSLENVETEQGYFSLVLLRQKGTDRGKSPS